MVAATIGAAATGQITHGAPLIVIFATYGALEALATARTTYGEHKDGMDISNESIWGYAPLIPQPTKFATSI